MYIAHVIFSLMFLIYFSSYPTVLQVQGFAVFRDDVDFKLDLLYTAVYCTIIAGDPYV